MTITKAIEILSEHANAGVATFNVDYKDALKLGIEALKNYASQKRMDEIWEGFKLPGETKE